MLKIYVLPCEPKCFAKLQAQMIAKVQSDMAGMFPREALKKYFPMFRGDGDALLAS